ncbi:MAG: phytanoyl-CoA dioxygenase family protein [Alphaproteobacteria bacterium]|nr:phytanoyl-CoA dioxygenase family protein [Alphaproteobacteria bacterium]
MFRETHWAGLVSRGYTVVSGAIDDSTLHAAQDAASQLNALHPDGGWERSRNELWREVRYCRQPEFMAIATNVLDPLALEILDSAPPLNFVQFASTMPGFATKGGVGRHFHLDGGQDQLLGLFNVIFGVALSRVASDTAGGFHVLPGSHDKYAAEFHRHLDDPNVHWGQVKLDYQRVLLVEAQLVVPRLEAGDIIVTHSFLAHGTSANTSDARRDMLFQRRAAAPLWDEATQANARAAFMHDPWAFFRKRPA